MPVLNPPEILPTALWAILRGASAFPGRRPTELRQVIDVDPALAGGSIFVASLAAARQLGLFTAGEALTPDPAVPLTSYNDFMAWVCHRMLSAGPVGEFNPAATDLVRSLCWLLSQDPRTGDITADRIERELINVTEAELPLRNSVRFQPFRRWAIGMGLAENGLNATAASLLPDPSRAIRRIVQQRWQGGQAIPVAVLLSELRGELPVLPGGHISDKTPWSTTGAEFAPSLAEVLIRGHEQGWWSLLQLPDAPDRMVLDASHDPPVPAVTHVEVGQP
jgi:hypothetical protein